MQNPIRRQLLRWCTLASLLLAAAAQAASNVAADQLPAIPPDGPLLQLRGSSTLARNAAPQLVSALLASRGFSDVRTEPLGHHELRISATSPAGKLAWVLISGHGSSTGFASMRSGNADVVMSSRPISSLETTQLVQEGNMLSAAAEHVVALDGIAVIVHPDNPLRELKTSQIAAIFSGQIDSWQQLGGHSGPIRRLLRDADSGTRSSFSDMVLRPAQLAMSADASILHSDSEIARQVAADPDAIGFVSLQDVGAARALAVSLPGRRSLLPTAETVACEDYPLSRRLYLYVSPQQQGWAAELARFAESPAGQQVVAASALVAQKITPVQVGVEPGMPPAYLRLIEGARRLSTTLRFRAGSELDNKSVQDLQRLVSYLRSSNVGSERLVLVGFNERSDSYNRSIAFSRMRAASIQQALSSQGIFVNEVMALGHSLPVADNDTDEGRLKNRRVEVWIN